MEAIFLSLLNTSISASWLILAVIGLRLVLKKTPKWVICLMWAVVAFRLLCPVSIESPVAMLPEPNITQEVVDANIPGIPILQNDAMPILQDTGLIDVQQPRDEISFTKIAANIWFIGVACMIIYLMVSYLHLHYQVREAALLFGNIWLCDNVRSPFILGIVRPRIYLPSSISERDVVHVVAHENAHLKRKDHWWKPLGFLLLSIFWFNPLMWIAYILMCRDIEIACDERVIRNFGLSEKKAYSEALLDCSSFRRLVIACPVAFGETAVFQRVRNVLNYKKPRFWIVLISLIIIIITAVVFVTVPTKEDALQNTESNAPALQESPNAEEDTAVATVPTGNNTKLNNENAATYPAEPNTTEEWKEDLSGIRIETITKEHFTAHVMVIRDPSKVYLATSSDELSMDTPGAYIDEVMERESALAAMNAGHFFDDGTGSEAVGSVPCGMVVSGGKTVWDDSYQTTPIRSFVGFNEDNILIVADSMTESEAADMGIRDGSTQGPILFVNGEPNLDVYNESSGYNARTAIGQCADGTVIFVCADGRSADSLGATYGDVMDILEEYKVINASAVNSGSSCAMYYRDESGTYGEKGNIQMINKLSDLQSSTRKMPTFWMVRPE